MRNFMSHMDEAYCTHGEKVMHTGFWLET